MNAYKKKNIKFCNEKLSRDFRHAETLKARESSRFKRLSMIRDMNDSDFNLTSFESVKPVEAEQKMENPTVSRLEMLKKWKQEKILKKELESKSKAKPFYVGSSSSANVTNQAKWNMKFPSNMNFNASKLAESRLESSAPKAVSSGNKGTGIPAFPKRQIKPSVSTISHTSSAPRSGNKNSKLPFVKSNYAEATKISKGTIYQKPKQESSVPKLTFPKLPNKTVQKQASAPSVLQKPTATNVIPKSTATNVIPKSKATNVIPKSTATNVIPKSTAPRKIPTKMLTPTVTKKPLAAAKPLEKESQQTTKNISMRKGFCFKKAVTDARKEKAENKKNVCSASANQKSDKKSDTKPSRMESVPAQSLEHIPNMTFNCDVSVIKPTNSFAPNGFKFQPPSGVSDFMFDDDDDDDDPFAVLQNFKLKYLSRTSTPTKNEDANTSPAKNTSPVDKNSSKKESSVSSLKDLQTTNEHNPTVSITRELFHDLSCTMSPKVDPNGFTKLDKNEIQEKNADGNVKVSDCGNEHIQNTYEERSKDSENFNVINLNEIDCSSDKILKTSDEKEACVKREIKELGPKIGNCAGELVQDETKEYTINDCVKSEVKELGPKIGICAGELVQDETKEYTSCDSPSDILDMNQINDCVKREIKDLGPKIGNCAGELVQDETKECTSCDSPFDIIDMNQINDWCEEPFDLMKLEDEKVNKKVDLPVDAEILKASRKSSRISHKRISMLKSISRLNVIAENSECEDSAKSSDNSVFAPHHSARLTQLQSAELIDSTVDHSPEERLVPDLPVTPRRSMRLQKAVIATDETKNEAIISPFTTKTPNCMIGTLRSARLTQLHSAELIDSTIDDSLEGRLVPDLPVTPRRSMRLQKAVIATDETKNEAIISPFTTKAPNRIIGTRRSMRLIDLNTPEKEAVQPGCSKSNLTTDFGKLNLNETENMDPNTFLIDFENSPVEMKSRKVSLLYSPKKRKSIRKSIRGDLMSFSPSE